MRWDGVRRDRGGGEERKRGKEGRGEERTQERDRHGMGWHGVVRIE